MKKNDILTGAVVGYGNDGEGIVREDGYTVFIPFAIPKEKVRYRVLKVRDNIVFAKAEEIITPAEDRARPACPVFGKCGGCQFMHMSYGTQLTLKRDMLENCVRKIGFIDAVIQRTLPSEDRLHYRNKLQIPVRLTEKGRAMGFFAPNSHRLIPINDCPIHGKWCAGAIAALNAYMDSERIDPYDELTGNGDIRHLVVKKIGSSYIVVLVVNRRKLRNIDHFIQLLKTNLKEAQFSLFLNLNTRRDNVILTDQFIRVKGDEYICASFAGLTYWVGCASFMQVNDYIKAKLYSRVRDLIDEEAEVIDAYCGIGLLTAIVAKKCRHVTGIEIVPEAVHCAKRTAAENMIENMDFICDACENVLPDLIKKDRKKTVILDPPRKGLGRRICETIASVRPEHIIYVSCNPQTFARDMGIIAGTLKYRDNELVKAVESPVKGSVGDLLPSGYRVEYFRGYDMFPQCKRLEVLCSLRLEK